MILTVLNPGEQRWADKFLDMADLVASWSKDESTKCGAIIVDSEQSVVSIGYNGIPRMVEDLPERQIRPQKYLWFEHAERNAIYNAARHGVTLNGSTIYITALPCADCARAIIQSGIVRVITRNGILIKDGVINPKWKEQWEVARQMFDEVGVGWRIDSESLKCVFKPKELV